MLQADGWCRLALAVGLAALAGSASGQDAVAAQDAEAGGSAGLETIVVTGTKLPDTVQETPASVVVISNPDTPSDTDLFDVLARIPNVTFIDADGLPFIRGSDGNGVAQGGGGAVTGGRPRVATYVDGVARSYSFTLDGVPSVWDVQQIEVYRGAQSATLGRNSIAGAIVVNTVDPVFEREFAVRAGVRDEQTTYSGAMMANLPLASAGLVLRVAGEWSDGEGYIDNVQPQLVGIDADRVERRRLGAKLLWVPPTQAAFRLLAGFSYDEVEQVGTSGTVTGDPAEYRNDDPFSYSFQQAHNRVYSLRPGYQLSTDWRLDAVLARQQSRNAYPSPTAIDGTFLDVFAEAVEDSFEPRAVWTSAISRSNAVVGAYLFQRDRDEGGTPGSAFEYSATDEAETAAAFADGRWQFAPRWDLRAGARYERETQDRRFSSPFGLALVVDEDVEVFLPKAGVDFHLNPEVTFGASYYEGYQPGGGGVSFTSFTQYFFEPEYARGLELFTRTQWLARRLTANANLFYTRNRDQQYFANGPEGPNDPVINNAHSTESYGVELDSRFRATASLQLFAGVGLLRTEVRDFGPGNEQLDGNRLGGDPELTLNLGADWQIAPAWSASANVNFIGDYFTTIDNVRGDDGGDYSLTNVETRYRWRQLEFSAYARNLFDRVALTARSNLFAEEVVQPRTLGAAVTARF